MSAAVQQDLQLLEDKVLGLITEADLVALTTALVAAGGETQRRREGVTERLARLFDAPGTPDGPLGETLRAGRVSELTETLRREAAGGRAENLPRLAPELMGAMVLPFLGMDAAQRELTRGPALVG